MYIFISFNYRVPQTQVQFAFHFRIYSKGTFLALNIFWITGIIKLKETSKVILVLFDNKFRERYLHLKENLTFKVSHL